MTQKKIKASDVIGNSYYNYNITSTDYTPSLNSTINITCTVTNIYGQTVSNKTITLYQNTTSKGEKTTANDGTATWNSINMTSAGLQVFRVENSKITVLVDNKSDTGHTHSQYLTNTDLSNYVTTDDTRLTNARTPLSHTHGNLQNTGQVGSTVQANKNVVTDSNGKITTEDKPTIPTASTSTPSADTTSGSYGSGTNYARSNHTHPKSTLYAEAEHNHTEYLTSSDIAGKANTTDLGAVAFSNNYNDLSNKPNIPSAVTVDTTLSSSSNNAIANSTVKNALDTKLDKTYTAYKGKNVVTNASTGTIEFEEKNNHTHSEYLTSHQDISGKIDTAGTGLSKTGTTLNHSNSVTALTTASFKKVKYDSQGHVTGTSDVSASDLPSHTHTKSQITDFPTIPSASSTTPSADTTNGSVGTGTTWARSNHTHPKSSLYAESEHTHSQYQPTLVSGTNLKTINNTSLLGSGNISITAGSNVTVDSALSTTSENPVQNKIITNKINRLGDIDSPVNHGISIFNTDSIYGDDYTLWDKLYYDSLNNIMYYLKNGDSSTDEIATMGDLPSVPSSSNTTPSADTTSGAVGTGTTWARADHKHPKSTIYADSSHVHGNLNNDGTITTSDSSTRFVNFIGVGDGSVLKKASRLQAGSVVDITAHSNIGSSANATQATINTNIDTALGGKAPTSHASTATTYGVATASNYGHTKVINNLTTSTNNNGEALSAYQGKVLNDGKANKSEVIDVNNIVFVDKTDDSTGAIILNFLT